MTTKSPSTTAGITVGELRRKLASFPDDADLFFGGLRFSRLKSRGEKSAARVPRLKARA